MHVYIFYFFMFPIKTDTNIIIFGAYIVYIVEPIDKQILFNTPSIVYTTSIALLSISNGNGCKQLQMKETILSGFI